MQVVRFVNRLLEIPSADPDDARRRKLLNILLLVMALGILLEFVAGRVIGLVGLESPLTGLDPLGVLAALLGVVVIAVINRFWSQKLAAVLFLLLLTVSVFSDSLEEVTAGRSLIGFAIPVVVASVVLRPAASFVMAGLSSLAIAVVSIGVLRATPDVAAMLVLFLIALAAWISALSLQRAVEDLRTANRDLDQRVVERTRDLQRRSVQLQTASEVARDATGTLDVEKLLDETVQLISERFGFYHAGVFLMDEQNSHVVLRAASSESGRRMLERGYELAVGKEGIVGHVAGTAEPFVVLDVGKEAAYLINPELPETRSEMALPLKSRGRLIGVLDVHSVKDTIFTSEDVATLQTMADQLANAIENARLYREAGRHVEELTALHNIDVAITSTLNLNEVLRIIYEQVSELIEVATFHVALYDEDKATLNCSLVIERGKYLPPSAVKCNFEEEGGFVKQAIRAQEAVWIDDLSADERAREDGLSLEKAIVGRGMRSLMMLPLVAREQVIGIIAAQSPEPGAFGADDRQLFSDIAHQAAIAITNARLYEEAEQRLAEAMLIQEVMVAAASTLDFDQVLERTIKALHRAKGFDRLGFLLPDEQDEILVPHPSLVGFEEEASGILIQGSLVGRVYRAGYPMLIREQPDGFTYPGRSPDTRAALAVPVRIGDRIAAVLCAESPQEGAFGEDEMRLFTTVAGQLGVMLENARLYQEMAQYTRDLRLLADASAGMIGPLEPQDIVEVLLGALAERFQEPCSISLMDADCREAILVAVSATDGQPVPQPVESKLHVSQHAWLEWLIETKHLIYVPDVEKSEWWPSIAKGEQKAVHQHDTRSILILPMLSQERLVGIASLRFREPLPEPVGDQLDWAQTLVNQAAAALTSAQLYQQLELQAKELARAYHELQEIDHLRTELVQNVSHELRTPLGLVKGYVELLIDGDLGEITNGQQAALQVIHERTATLSRLINNLTMLQAIPREALALAPLAMGEVIEGVLSGFQGVAGETGIVFRQDVPEDLPFVIGDRDRLELVLGHLVDNAIKFSPGGGAITLRAWADPETVSVSIADEGIGIPPEHLDRIFERFYQIDGSTKRRFGGMGVGLALVWEIVEAHGGSVGVESEPGRGSTFTITLLQA